MRFPRILLIVLAVMGGIAPARAAHEATITVRPTQVIGKVNPMVFGNNQLAYQGIPEFSDHGAGIWDPERQVPVPEYVALSRKAGISVQRWPGGCTTHDYNWKLTVGPLSQRPQQHFGLPEFLTFCQATNSQPLISIAVFWGDASDAADLVEYLNAPNDGKNPNGGTDWAAVRAADGHPQPYGVVWFEYGNEDYHGEHKSAANPNPRTITAAEYAANYHHYQAAMKQIDPKIRLGGILQNGLWEWNRVVLEGCGRQMDFAIEHTYIPGYSSNKDEIPGRKLMQACTASAVAIQAIYDRMLAQIQDTTGRTDLKLAITEHNGFFVQEKPVPYRQALANALRNAEHLRVMMQPKNRILMANLWHFSNAYWGMVQGHVERGEKLVPQANYFPYQLYHEHFGDTLVRADVRCGTWDFDGAGGVPVCKGKPRTFKLYAKNLLPANYAWEERTPDGSVTQEIAGKVVTAHFQDKDVNFYSPRLELPAEPDMGYRITGYIKTEALTGVRGACFQAGDARGWTETQSCTISDTVSGTNDWTKVSFDYRTLGNTRSIEIMARRLRGGPVSGSATYKLASVQKFRPAGVGAVPDLGVNCATRPNGAVTVMIVNKNLDESVPLSLQVAGKKARPGKAQAWILSGPSPVANNLKEEGIGVRETPVALQNGAYSLTLPACSMAAVEIAP